jgi:hypothetical protein
MGKDSGGTQTTTSKTEYPQWVQDAGQKNLAASYQVSANMKGPYEGDRVAGMTNDQLANINSLQQNVGMSQPAMSAAQAGAANVMGYNPAMANAGQLSNTDLSPYMNPFTQNVINSGLSALDVQRRQALNQAGDQAIKSGAFGGSRLGIQEGVTNAGAAQQAGNLASQLQMQNFTQAQGAATNDINRNLQAQLANQQAGLSGAGLNLQGANALGQLGTQAQQNFLGGTAAAMSAQDQIQQQRQAQLGAQQQLYTEQQQFPLQQLQIPLQALGATPYGNTQSQTGPGPQSNGLATGLGAAASVASIAAAFM